jgi:spore germination protein YaaH
VALRSDRVRFRLVIAPIIATGTLVAAAVALPGMSTAAGPRLAVLGFQSEYTSPNRIDRNARAMTMVGVDGVDLDGPGSVSRPDAAARRQLARAQADGLPGALLVGNWSNRVNDFYEPLAYETLRSQATVDRAAGALADDVRSQGWNGVSVDLESLRPRDQNGLTRFVSDLRAKLPPGDSLTICLQASTSLAGYRASGYDLRGLAAGADQIVLMTYDDHGPWENSPGPIGPLPWQRASIHALERVVPPGQVFLGVADYGYAWRPHSNDSLSVAQARALVARWRAKPRWVPRAGEWTANLSDGSTVWWSNARSIRQRITLAREMGVHGIAVWSLAGDPLPSVSG